MVRLERLLVAKDRCNLNSGHLKQLLHVLFADQFTPRSEPVFNTCRTFLTYCLRLKGLGELGHEDLVDELSEDLVWH